MRYVTGGALVLGIAAGVWLSDWFKGLGLGGGAGVGIGQRGMSGIQANADGEPADIGVSYQTTSVVQGPPSLRVVIKDRSYFLRDGETDTPIELPALVEAIKQQPPDDDGIKLRLYQTNDARQSARVALLEELQAAGVPAAAVHEYQDAVE